MEKVGAWAELLPSEGVAASGRLHGGAERHVPPAGLSLVAGAETQHKLSPLTWVWVCGVCVCGGGWQCLVLRAVWAQSGLFWVLRSHVRAEPGPTPLWLAKAGVAIAGAQKPSLHLYRV